MLYYLGWAFGWPLYLLGKFGLNNYTLIIITYLTVVCLIYSLLNLLTVKRSVRVQCLKKYTKKCQSNFLPTNESSIKKLNDDCTLELYNRLKVNPIVGIIATIGSIVFIYALFYVLSHPLTYLYGLHKNFINEIKITSGNIVGFPEFSKLLSVISNSKIFNGLENLELIKNSNVNLLGVNVLVPSSIQNWTVLVPIAVVALSFYKEVYRIVKKIKSRDKFTKSDWIVIGFSIFILISLVTSAFLLPMVVYLYYLIFRVVNITVSVLFKERVIKKETDKCKRLEAELDEIISGYVKKKTEFELGNSTKKEELVVNE